MLKIALLGSGGHATAVCDIVSRIKNLQIEGYIDKKKIWWI